MGGGWGGGGGCGRGCLIPQLAPVCNAPLRGLAFPCSFPVPVLPMSPSAHQPAAVLGRNSRGLCWRRSEWDGRRRGHRES